MVPINPQSYSMRLPSATFRWLTTFRLAGWSA